MKLSAMLFGFTTDFASALEMWKIFWRSGASPSATKPSDSGVGSLVSNTPGHLGAIMVVWGDTRHLDQLFATIQGQQQCLWRAVDQDDHVIDILVQPRRDQRLITDKLRTYEAPAP